MGGRAFMFVRAPTNIACRSLADVDHLVEWSTLAVRGRSALVGADDMPGCDCSSDCSSDSLQHEGSNRETQDPGSRIQDQPLG